MLSLLNSIHLTLTPEVTSMMIPSMYVSTFTADMRTHTEFCSQKPRSYFQSIKSKHTFFTPKHVF